MVIIWIMICNYYNFFFYDVVVCVDGIFYKYVFILDGNCNWEVYDVFLELGDDNEFWNFKWIIWMRDLFYR